MLRLELVDITKEYPGVRANDSVSLKVEPGEIHAVLGENGAGKSTLMEIIYGVTEPDAGEVRFDGKAVRITSPEHARKLGIAMVFQHFSLFETLTVAENVWLGLDRSHSLAGVTARILEVAASYGLEIDPARPVHALSVGERQRVEIVRALLTKPSLLILDEPTSVLTPQAVEKLFVTLRKLAADGCSILYISHKLDEIRALCQRCTVLRGGRVTGETDPTTATNAELSRLMIGAEPPELEHRALAAGDTALELIGLSAPRADAYGVALDGVELVVRSGEIVGIAGISGNGQKELCAVLSGERNDVPSGSVRLFGNDVVRASPKIRRALGLRFVPEERLGRATVTTLSLADNTLLTRTESVRRSGFIDRRRVRILARRLIDAFHVKSRGEAAPAKSLSGGNLQKFIVGREIDAAPRVLVVSQPTWGVDVGASAQIRGELLKLRDAGAAVLVVSEELDELFEVSDFLVVMAEGRLSPRVPTRSVTRLEIGEWMSGLWPARPPGRRRRGSSVLRLEPRPQASRAMALASPLVALLLTTVVGVLLFVALGKDPVRGLEMFFVEPLKSERAAAELSVKATPLLLIALGLCVCFRSNVWNIGAEGQFMLGAVFATGVAIRATPDSGALLVVCLLVAGVVGGMLWAGIAAFLRDRFNANEILVSLMLVYVAEQLLSYLVYGPWKDPHGYNFPQTITFLDSARIPRLIEGSRANIGSIIALVLVAATWLFLYRTHAGFKLEVGGLAPAAARYAGFSSRSTLWTALLVSGGMAGLAGALEVAGPVGQLTTHVPLGYGFAAIIVAFVGRLNPVGAVFASVLMSMFYIGGEMSQSRLGLPKALTGVFQGLLLFALLACDTLILYRVRWRSRARRPLAAVAPALDPARTAPAAQKG